MTGRNGGGEFESTLEDVNLAAEAAQLRALRMTYPQIAERMHCSVSTAHRRVKQALAAVPVEAVGELRKVEGEVLDASARDLMLQLKGATRGEKVALHRELRLNRESYRRLMGTDMPQQHVVRIADPLQEEIERLAAELGVLDPTADSVAGAEVVPGHSAHTDGVPG